MMTTVQMQAFATTPRLCDANRRTPPAGSPVNLRLVVRAGTDALFLVALGCVLDTVTDFFHLLPDLLCGLVNLFAGLLCGTFLLLTAGKSDKQGADE
jgi:hypothetical protein